MRGKETKGITLIALIITVIVLLILAGTAISIAINGGDIFSKAADARNQWNSAVATEQEKVNEVWNILNTMTSENNGGGTNPAEPTATATATATPAPAGITMTLGAAPGTQVTLTQSDFAQHLGKIVTNYTGAPTTLGDYTVSNTYRLYWIDWENKYGDGAGTIYLKADCTSNNYSLSREATTEAIDPTTSVIRKLNPELYKNDTTTNQPNPPAVNSDNMKAVRWLLNPDNWFDNTHATKLTNGLASSIAAKVNYVVGAPSLEMMMDSYNAHYGKTESTPTAGDRTASSDRTTLFYKYPYNEYNYGYGVGPGSSSAYSTSTAQYTVPTDTADPSIDSMYYPGSGTYYWLASPSANNPNNLMIVLRTNGGFVNCNRYLNTYALCPLVSLQSDVSL